jgi:hypothetical protein
MTPVTFIFYLFWDHSRLNISIILLFSPLYKFVRLTNTPTSEEDSNWHQTAIFDIQFFLSVFLKATWAEYGVTRLTGWVAWLGNGLSFGCKLLGLQLSAIRSCWCQKLVSHASWFVTSSYAKWSSLGFDVFRGVSVLNVHSLTENPFRWLVLL